MGIHIGSHQAIRTIEQGSASLCIIADSCSEKDYLTLVQALCREHNVSIIQIESRETVGALFGLFQTDSETNSSNGVGCSCAVVTRSEKNSEQLTQLKELLENNK